MREPPRAAHVKAVWAATGLGVVFYNRANATIGADALAELADSCPNLVGFKDGVGARFGDRFTHVGGLPTAETFALPYLQLGVTLDRAGLDRAHALYVEHGLGARDDAAAMQYFFDGWTFDPKRPAFVR